MRFNRPDVLEVHLNDSVHWTVKLILDSKLQRSAVDWLTAIRRKIFVAVCAVLQFSGDHSVVRPRFTVTNRNKFEVALDKYLLRLSDPKFQTAEFRTPKQDLR